MEVTQSKRPFTRMKLFSSCSGNDQASTSSSVVLPLSESSQPGAFSSSNQHGGMCIYIYLDLSKIIIVKNTIDIRARCNAALSRLENVREGSRFGSEARSVIRQTRKRVGSVLVGINKRRK